MDAGTRDGFTPLHFAVSTGQSVALAALLVAGADTTAATVDGQTAASMAEEQLEAKAEKVRTTPSWPRSWANFSLL